MINKDTTDTTDRTLEGFGYVKPAAYAEARSLSLQHGVTYHVHKHTAQLGATANMDHGYSRDGHPSKHLGPIVASYRLGAIYRP